MNEFTKYRYTGGYGYIMIGARSTKEALKEAERSMVSGSVAVVGRLEIWNSKTEKYEAVK